jgi:hypothetical protein
VGERAVVSRWNDNFGNPHPLLLTEEFTKVILALLSRKIV